MEVAQEMEQVEQVIEEISPERRVEERRMEERKTRPGFINGLAVGFGIGCIAAFIILWTAVYFSPQLPAKATYENMLVIFVYPLLYLLALGLVSLTTGIVREHYANKEQ